MRPRSRGALGAAFAKLVETMAACSATPAAELGGYEAALHGLVGATVPAGLQGNGDATAPPLPQSRRPHPLASRPNAEAQEGNRTRSTSDHRVTNDEGSTVVHHVIGGDPPSWSTDPIGPHTDHAIT
jgi:hypothetical protein